MQKVLLIVLCIIVCLSTSLWAVPEWIIYIGNTIDGGSILVSSYGIVADGYTFTVSSSFVPTQPALSGTTYDNAEEISWSIYPQGAASTYDVWFDSHAGMSTTVGAADEGCRMPAGNWYTIKGRCYDKFFLRTKAGLAPWTTVYFIKTTDE